MSRARAAVRRIGTSRGATRRIPRHYTSSANAAPRSACVGLGASWGESSDAGSPLTTIPGLTSPWPPWPASLRLWVKLPQIAS